MEAKIKKLFKTVFTAAQDLKAEDIIALDMRGQSSYTDYVLIASGSNERQIQAMADRILDESYKKCKYHPLGTEGYESLQWVLIDFGDVVCHIFHQDVRDQYHLEDMWPKIVPMQEEEIVKYLAGKKTKKKVAEKKVIVRKSS